MSRSINPRRSRLLLVIVACATLLTPAVAADASITPSPSYVAGSSVAGRPSYDATTGQMLYNCAFAGWAHVKVNSVCELTDLSGTVLSSHSKSFTSGSFSTSTFSYTKITQTRCVVADAAYSDGSSGDSDTKCF